MKDQARLLHEQAYWSFLGTCTQCGKCMKSCESLIAAGYTLGDIAHALLAAQKDASTKEEIAQNISQNADLIQAVRGCFFCESCKNTCFAHNDVCDLIYSARADFNDLGLIPRDTYSSVLVDEEWDIFTAYRAIYGINHEDMKRHLLFEGHEPETDCQVAFFPGCSLAAYAPDLTREIYQTLDSISGKATLIDHCCGSPLKSAGFFDRAEALCEKSAREIADSGAHTLICVCPGCANAMESTFERLNQNVRVVSLAAYLFENDFKPLHDLPHGKIYLAKSCQDRDGSYLAETCSALGIDPNVPVIYDGCCGAGGAVSSFEPERQDHQADEKLSFAPDEALVISMCPTCTYTYAFRLLQNPRNISNKHYAELLFNTQIDWTSVYNQLVSMYSGPYGPWLMQVFG